MRDHVPRMVEHRAGMDDGIKIEDVVIESGRRPHGSPPLVDELKGRAGCPARPMILRADVSGQAALDSIWVTLASVAPPIAMRRGFLASGISR